MSFPTGWTQNRNHEWERTVEPSAAAVTYALMGLPAATIIKYSATANENWADAPVTLITYDPVQQEAVLS